ncbi:MAG: hypothetical protein MR890_08120 [Akkermansia muciniphila]|nr:hypothetical protein [Akkermansia muciniphila]
MARRRRTRHTAGKASKGATGGLWKRIRMWLGIGAAGLVLAGVVGYHQLLSYLQGDKFRADAAGVVANKAQADKAELKGRLSISGGHVTLPAFELRRRDIVDRVAAEGIQADINRGELWDRCLHVTKLTMEELAVQLDALRLGKKLPPVRKSKKTFVSRFLPETVKLDKIECKDADLSAALLTGDLRLMGCGLKASPLSGGGWTVNLTNGKARLPLYGLNECGLRSASVHYSPRRISLTNCYLSLTPGEMHLTANYEPGSGCWRAKARITKANVERVLTSDWKQRIRGDLFGDLEMSGTRGLQSARGVISLKDGYLEGLPILSELPFATMKPYRTMEVEKAECRITYPYTESRLNISDAWMIDNIDIRAGKGKLLVKGHVIIGMDGTLGGSLRIGLPLSVTDALPLPVRSLFNTGDDAEYSWITMNLSGSLDHPQQDLSVRMNSILTALPGAAVDTATGTLRDLAKHLTDKKQPQEQPETETPETPEQPQSSPAEQPTAPTDSGPVKGVLDAAGEAVDSIFSIL